MSARSHRLTRWIDDQLVDESFDAYLHWRYCWEAQREEQAARWYGLLGSRLVP